MGNGAVIMGIPVLAEIDHEQPARFQPIVAIVVEACRAEFGRLAVPVETVDKDDVGPRRITADMICPIGTQDPEPTIIIWV